MDKTFYEDLLAAQKEIEAVDKDGKNPFFKSDYATLNATILACKEILNKHNLVVLQPIQSDEFGVYVCSVIVHTSGEKIESRMKIEPAKINDPQAQGSAITYARRYSLKSLLTLSDNDDDGESAMARTTHATNTTVSQSTVSKSASKPFCEYHKVEMFQTPNMKSPAHKDEVRGWCNGAGYADEKDAWRNKTNSERK